MTAPDTRPYLAFTVGVTGTRTIDPMQLPALRQRARAALLAVQAVLDEVAAQSGTAYRPDPDGIVRPRLRLLSPLAEGADRLLAHEALALGWQLDVVLPFPRAIYAADFPASAAEFRNLLAHAEPPGEPGRVLELDGTRGTDLNASYQAVGRTVVRCADLLVALWDGAPEKGRGGTAEIVRFAARFGPRVWWIPLDATQPPRLVDHPVKLRQPDRALSGREGEEALQRGIRETLLPPPPNPEAGHGLFARLEAWVRADRPFDPLAEYHAADLPPEGPPRWPWNSFARALDWIAPARETPWREPADGPWMPQYRRADTLATMFAQRYRSGYVIIFALAFAAVTFAALGLFIPAVQYAAKLPPWAKLAGEFLKPAMLWLELLALALIGLLVWRDTHNHWHDRWIGCRMLAELCRQQQALATLGWSLPALQVVRAPTHDGHTGAPRDAWVAWYFTALMRAAPLAGGVLDGPRKEDIRAEALALVASQIDYHHERERRYDAANAFLVGWGLRLFVLTILLIAVKLVLLASLPAGLSTTFSLAGAILPAISAAFVGIRAYAEFELLLLQSRRMLQAMEQGKAALTLIDADRPLASQLLGAELLGVADAMLEDVTGWAQLSRGKPLEAG